MPALASSAEPLAEKSPSTPPKNLPRAKNQASELVAEALAIPAGGTIVGQPWPLSQAMAASPDRKQQLAIIHGYWQLTEAVAKYHFAFEQTKQFEQIARPAGRRRRVASGSGRGGGHAAGVGIGGAFRPERFGRARATSRGISLAAARRQAARGRISDELPGIVRHAFAPADRPGDRPHAADPLGGHRRSRRRRPMPPAMPSSPPTESYQASQIDFERRDVRRRTTLARTAGDHRNGLPIQSRHRRIRRRRARAERLRRSNSWAALIEPAAARSNRGAGKTRRNPARRISATDDPVGPARSATSHARPIGPRSTPTGQPTPALRPVKTQPTLGRAGNPADTGEKRSRP